MDVLLDAAPLVWRSMPEAQFVFIGPRTTYSRRLFNREHDHRVMETGAVSIQEKTDAFAACDVFCLPSSQESFGGVFIEAWNLGKPVIGGNAPAVSEVITDGVNGFVVEPQAPMLADRIVALLQDSNMREQMGTAGKFRAAGFAWSVLAARTEAIYKDLLQGR